jgi:acyl-CoA thioesterase I
VTDESQPGGLRICVVGDDLVAGVGDPKSLGWTGRVAARTPRPAGGLGVFPLGVPGEATPGLVERWYGECSRRFDGSADNRLVVGLGSGDVDAGTSMARSRLNLANVLDDAMSRSVSTFVVGPPPGQDAARNERVAELSAAFADVCDRRSVPFVDCYGPLSSHEQWFSDLAAGDGTHPGQAGYGLVAWLVLHGGWHSWLGLPQG